MKPGEYMLNKFGAAYAEARIHICHVTQRKFSTVGYTQRRVRKTA